MSAAKKVNHRQALGKWGEKLAAEYLQAQGYAILERNARTPYGEIDLVVRYEPALEDANFEQPMIIFVEVKTRRTRTFGPPEVSITARKKEHMMASAQAYLQAHPELDGDWRMDVIAIENLKANQKPEITHFENAFTEI